jgi:hypothetical protein
VTARRAVAAALLAALALAGAAILAGCGAKGITKPLGGPHTMIFINAPVDTQGVNHIVRLHWYGTDPNGYIAGYEVRLIDSAFVVTDTGWVFTVHTDSVVVVPTPLGYTSKVFEARAINDRGVKDPNPAIQHFYFRNQPPIVRILTKPNAADKSDTTFASATITWSVTDLDGDVTKVLCRVWMDGHENDPTFATGTSFTVPSEQFKAGGVWVSGRRSLHIQGIDDGGMAGPIDSVSWYVKAPVDNPDPQGYGRLLWIDDLPAGDPSNVRSDSLYANSVARAGLPAGSWRVLRLETTQPFRSPKDLEQTLKQFRAVIWARGEQAALTKPATTLANNLGGVGPYLDSGGHMFLESLSPAAAWTSVGPLTPSFVDRYLDCDGVFVYGQAPDSSAAWGFNGNEVLTSPLLSDSLLNKRILVGLNGFKFRDPGDVLLSVGAHVMSQDNPYPFAVALAVPQSNGGLLMVSSYPLVSGTISTPAFPQRSSEFLGRILQRLGATGP